MIKKKKERKKGRKKERKKERERRKKERKRKDGRKEGGKKKEKKGRRKEKKGGKKESNIVKEYLKEFHRSAPQNIYCTCSSPFIDWVFQLGANVLEQRETTVVKQVSKAEGSRLGLRRRPGTLCKYG